MNALLAALDIGYPNRGILGLGACAGRNPFGRQGEGSRHPDADMANQDKGSAMDLGQTARQRKPKPDATLFTVYKFCAI